MDEQKLEFSCISDDSNLATFEGKIKEKCYELQIKRNTLAEVRSKLHQEFIEKHNLELSLEKASRECEETKIQLDVAIKAARLGESERANNREILARQSVQLEATMKDRNFLQEQIRKLQLENSDLQRQLDQADEKVKGHYHLQETCKIKETQWRTYFETLQSQTKALEQAHTKLKEITIKALTVSRKAIFQLTYERNNLKEALTEKNKLNDQVFSLSDELERLKREVKGTTEKKVGIKLYLEEWENAQQQMVLKSQEHEKEMVNLQNSLSGALATISQLQKSENSKDERIKSLENEIEEIKHKKILTEEKSQQCDFE